jgi:hypothetical protein
VDLRLCCEHIFGVAVSLADQNVFAEAFHLNNLKKKRTNKVLDDELNMLLILSLQF